MLNKSWSGLFCCCCLAKTFTPSSPSPPLSFLFFLPQHPSSIAPPQQNYCGELLFWWGTFIAGMNVGPTVSDDASIVVLVGYMFTSISIVGPLCMTALFFGISVDLMEARQLKNKKIEYEKYKKNVPSAILLCPRCGGGNGGRNRNEEKEE